MENHPRRHKKQIYGQAEVHTVTSQVKRLIWSAKRILRSAPLHSASTILIFKTVNSKFAFNRRFEGLVATGKSPTLKLLYDWGTTNATVGELVDILVKHSLFAPATVLLPGQCSCVASFSRRMPTVGLCLLVLYLLSFFIDLVSRPVEAETLNVSTSE